MIPENPGCLKHLWWMFWLTLFFVPGFFETFFFWELQRQESIDKPNPAHPYMNRWLISRNTSASQGISWRVKPCKTYTNHEWWKLVRILVTRLFSRTHSFPVTFAEGHRVYFGGGHHRIPLGSQYSRWW